MLKKSLALLFATTLLVLLQNPTKLWAAPNLSGIWSGEFKPSHFTISSTSKGSDKQSDAKLSDLDLTGELRKMLSREYDDKQKSAPKSLHFKVKIYYVGNQAHIINQGGDPKTNLLIFVDYAQFCLASLQRHQRPSILQNIDLPFGNQGISHHNSASGAGHQAGIRHEIVSDSTLTRDPIKDILFFKMTATIKTEIRIKDKIKTHTIKTKVAFPFKRVPFDSAAWSDDEIDHLLTGATQHTLSQATTVRPPGNGPLSRVATFIFDDSREGYLRLFAYAAKKYSLSTPKEFDIDMDDYTTYSKLKGVSGLYADMFLCRQAFSFNILFLASSYVHEYIHFIQFKNGQKFDKFNRETEAHCIQKEWINNQRELPGTLSFSKTQLTDKLDSAFAGEYGSALQCRNGTVPRNWVRAKINSLTPTSRGIAPFAEGSPEPMTPNRNKWRTVVE